MNAEEVVVIVARTSSVTDLVPLTRSVHALDGYRAVEHREPLPPGTLPPGTAAPFVLISRGDTVELWDRGREWFLDQRSGDDPEILVRSLLVGGPSGPPPPLPRRTLVLPVPAPAGGVQRVDALARVAADELAEQGTTSVTVDELEDAVLAGNVRSTIGSGCVDDECIEAVTKLGIAETTLGLRVASGQDRVLVTASLFASGEVVRRGVVTAHESQLEGATRVAVRRALGRIARLDPLPGADDALSIALRTTSARIAEIFRRARVSQLDRVAVLGFATPNVGSGESIRIALMQTLADVEGLPLVSRARFAELEETGVDARTDLAATGRFLGSDFLVAGELQPLGAHDLVTVRLLRSAGDELLQTSFAVAKGTTLSDAQARAIVKRSRSGAIYRSMLAPSWGQFYNEQPVKGGIIATLSLGAVATAAAGFVLAAGKQSEADAYTLDGERGVSFCAAQNLDATSCRAALNAEREPLLAERDDLHTIGIVGIAAFGVVYLFALVDAALAGEDHSDVSFTASSAPGRQSLTIRF